MDGMALEVRDSCVAGSVCDQTDDQLEEQVPGLLGFLHKLPGLLFADRINSPNWKEDFIQDSGH